VTGADDSRRARVAALRSEGRSIREVAAALGCGVATVYRLLASAEHPESRTDRRAEHRQTGAEHPNMRAEQGAEHLQTGAEHPQNRAEHPQNRAEQRAEHSKMRAEHLKMRAEHPPEQCSARPEHPNFRAEQGAEHRAEQCSAPPEHRAEHPSERCSARAEHPSALRAEHPAEHRSARPAPARARFDDPFRAVLERLPDARRGGNGYEARCPAHDDRHASLSVTRGDDGRVLLHCHAGCAPIAVCQALGLRLGDLFPPHQNGDDAAEIEAIYDYRDAEGRLLFQVVRFTGKRFRQRRPDGAGWSWKLGRTPRVLYRLPELLAADPAERVYIVEGEKDADRLAALGLVATCNPGGAGKWSRLADDTALHGRRVAILADKDAAGRHHATDVAQRLRALAADVRLLELPGPGKDVSDWLDAGGTADALHELADAAGDRLPAGAHDELPVILIDTAEHRVVGEAIAALTADPDLYQRGGILVRVLRDRQPTDGILRCDGSATIQAMPAPNLRERLTRCAAFTKRNRNGDTVAAHPAGWLVSAIEARGEWDGIRRLLGVSDAPILRPDGSVWQSPGFDERTGVLFEPAAGVTFPAIHPEVTIDDADAALTTLLELVCDFPFESAEHQAAWLAALLTPLARFAFAGPTPLFLIDANVRGAGKGLLAQTIGRVVLGREMPVSSYAHDPEEMRKKITAIAIAGDRMILFDNLEGSFGNDALDRALTSTRWKDRILGRSEEIELPLIPAWYATGNNVQVAADTLRRIIHIRIDCLDEHPEDRAGFRHDNLLAWGDANRGRLLAAALTILSAFLRSGVRPPNLRPYGSFEGWSRVVREAVVWLGLPDPCRTRTRLAESADTTGDALGQLIAAWRQFDWSQRGVVVSDMLRELYPSSHGPPPGDDGSIAMRAALENLVGCPPGKAPTARQVGNKLRLFRRRVVDKVFLDSNPAEYARGGVVWRLVGVGSKASEGALRLCDSDSGCSA